MSGIPSPGQREISRELYEAAQDAWAAARRRLDAAMAELEAAESALYAAEAALAGQEAAPGVPAYAHEALPAERCRFPHTCPIHEMP